MKFLLEETTNRFQSVAPVAVIDTAAYGMMDGEKVLKTAIKLIKTYSAK